MTCGGVAAGASTPYHVVNEYPGTPASATVGTSGTTDERFALVTASARTLPDLMCGTMFTGLLKPTSTSPASMAIWPAPPPRYWIATMLVRVSVLKSSMERCELVPRPEDA